MSTHDALVIGAGQAGLAAATALRARGLQPVVLEAGAEPVGSWPHYYDSLTLFSPARYAAIDGRHPFPGDPDRYPHRDEVVDYLRGYADRLDADIRTGQRVERVEYDGEGYRVHTAAQTYDASLLIAATGGFGNPWRPSLPGLNSFDGQVLHAGQYRSPEPFRGQRILVVGAGNSAVQIGAELAGVANVSLVTRAPIKYGPYRPLGRDIHFWSAALGIDHLPIGHLLRAKPTVPVIDNGGYRAAVQAGRPAREPMFARLDGDEVTWPDGRTEHVDAVLLATGYRPDLGYLAGLGALDEDGEPRQLRGLSCTHPGLGYVGLEWQRSLASATLRGVLRDAHYVARRLLRTNANRSPACCALAGR